MANDTSYTTLGLVAIVAIVGVVGLVTMLQGRSTQVLHPSANQGADQVQTPQTETPASEIPVPENIKQSCNGNISCMEKKMEKMNMTDSAANTAGQAACPDPDCGDGPKSCYYDPWCAGVRCTCLPLRMD